MTKTFAILMVLMLCGCEESNNQNNPCDVDIHIMHRTAKLYFLSKCVVELRKELSEIKEILKSQEVRK